MVVMSAIALIKTKVTFGRKKSPWRNATLIKAEKDVDWLNARTKLQVHYDILK